METNIIYNEDYLLGISKIDDKSISLVVTDPPYLFVKGGMKNDKFNIGKMAANSYMNAEMGDFDQPKIYSLLDALKPKFKNNYNAYFFCSEMQITYYLQWAIEQKLRYNLLVWDRQVKTMISTKFFRSNLDYIIRIYGSGESLNDVTGVYDKMNLYSKIKSYKQGEETIHETEKPVKLIEEFVKLSSKPDDLVLDPFMGSGTTAIACKELNRKFIGFEINPEYYQIAIDRIEKYNKTDFDLF